MNDDIHLDSTGESMIGNMSIRSLLAACIIIPGMLTLCWDAIQTGEVQWIIGIMGTVLGFLYGSKTGARNAIEQISAPPTIVTLPEGSTSPDSTPDRD